MDNEFDKKLKTIANENLMTQIKLNHEQLHEDLQRIKRIEFAIEGHLFWIRFGIYALIVIQIILHFVKSA